MLRGALVVLAVLVLSQMHPVSAAPGNFLVDLTLAAQRVGDKAVGNATITNPSKDPITVGKVAFDIRFWNAASEGHKDDIRQRFVLKQCGNTQLPVKLAPGAKLVCPFTTDSNIYHGAITLVAGVLKPSDPDSLKGDYLGFDVISKLMPVGQVDTSAPAPAAAHTYTATGNANIPGHDVTSCRYTGNGSKFCRLCGGRAKVQAACDANTDCVAFDMEGADCGYLKAAKGPLKTTAPGFTTYARV